MNTFVTYTATKLLQGQRQRVVLANNNNNIINTIIRNHLYKHTIIARRRFHSSFHHRPLFRPQPQPSQTTHHFSTTGNNNNNNSNSSDSTNYAFDSKLKLLQRDGAARAHQRSRQHQHNQHNDDPSSSSSSSPINYDYFRTETATRLVERLDDIIRDDGFPLALDIGSGPGYIYRAICKEDGLDTSADGSDGSGGGTGGIGGVRNLVQLDSSHISLHRDDDILHTIMTQTETKRCATYQLHYNEEQTPLPFPSGTFDLVLSSGTMHRINDLPSLLLEIKRVLKPDGCFLFSMVGGSSTLQELRSALVLAESEREGGVSTHIGPFVDVSDVGSLLTSAGFALPTVDVDTMTLSYPNAMVLMEHLQRMGEGNACVNRRGGSGSGSGSGERRRVGKETFLAAACLYEGLFRLDQNGADSGNGDNGDDNGGDGASGVSGGTIGEEVEATVQVIYAIGWSPHESQQQPDKRGSAKLKVGEMVEHTAGGSSSSSSDGGGGGGGNGADEKGRIGGGG